MSSTSGRWVSRSDTSHSPAGFDRTVPEPRPVAAGSIDLVVIDEASQRGLAQILPLAYRAKRRDRVGHPQEPPPGVTADPGQRRGRLRSPVPYTGRRR